MSICFFSAFMWIWVVFSCDILCFERWVMGILMEVFFFMLEVVMCINFVSEVMVYGSVCRMFVVHCPNMYLLESLTYMTDRKWRSHRSGYRPFEALRQISVIWVNVVGTKFDTNFIKYWLKKFNIIFVEYAQLLQNIFSHYNDKWWW